MDFKFDFGNIDFIFLIIILLFSINSFIKGFMHEALSIIVLLFSAFIGYKINSFTSYFLIKFINYPTLLPILSFVISFFASYCILNIFAQSLAKKLNLNIGITDRFLGLIFGFLKALFMILLFYIVLNLFIPISMQPKFLTNSFFREIIMPIEKQLFYNLNNVNMKLN